MCHRDLHWQTRDCQPLHSADRPDHKRYDRAWRQILSNPRAEPRSVWSRPAFASPLLNMNSKTVFRLSAVAAVIALLGIASPASAQSTTLPPLNAPPTSLRIPGKLIWADLFTTDPEAATKFYCGVFGWTAVTLDQIGRAHV